jgi:aminopeptidase
VLEVDAERGADAIRTQMATDRGAARLGEVALVDGASPVGQSGLVFGNLLIDENATSHIAWGSAYAFTVPDPAQQRRRPRGHRLQSLGRAAGRDDRRSGRDVHAIDAAGAEVPVIVNDAWVLA